MIAVRVEFIAGEIIGQIGECIRIARDLNVIVRAEANGIQIAVYPIDTLEDAYYRYWKDFDRQSKESPRTVQDAPGTIRTG